jgi:hypothetical protein
MSIMAKRIALALAAVLGACFGPDAPLGVPCAMNNDCPSGQTCNPDKRRCEPPSGLELWRDDTAADFGAVGAVAEDAAVEAAGFVGPAAYFGGGLRLSGIDRHAIPDPATPWNELAGAARTGTTFVRGIELSFSGTPPGLGLPGGNDITVLVEGEVYLDAAGPWGFQLDADDIGFVEIAPPGSATFERVVTDQNNSSEGFYQAAAPGWHRLRGAFADSAADMDYVLRYDPPGPGNFRTIQPWDLRAPAGDVAGVIVDGFEDAFLMGPGGSVLHPGTLGGQVLGTDPYGLPVGNSSYSLRFAGQVLIDTGGSYAFRIDSDQGHRMWLDGALVVDKLGTAAEISMTEPALLEPGWHDLVVDLNRKDALEARLDVTVDSGPAWVGQTIPLDHLRPIVGRANRWAGAFSSASTAIPEGGTSTRTLIFDVPPDFVTTRVDVAFQFTHPVRSSILIRVDPPNAGLTTVVPAGSLTGSGSYFRYTTIPVSPAGTNWGVLATDTAAADLMTGSLTYAGISLLGTAGPAPFPESYRYVSAPRELGNVASIAYARWGLRQETPDATVTVSLRTCDSAAACDGEAWTAVSQGAAPDVPVRRFAQYMVELTGNSDVPTALDWIEIGYRTFGN